MPRQHGKKKRGKCTRAKNGAAAAVPRVTSSIYRGVTRSVIISLRVVSIFAFIGL
jgi:hypothetical protein